MGGTQVVWVCDGEMEAQLVDEATGGPVNKVPGAGEAVGGPASEVPGELTGRAAW